MSLRFNSCGNVDCLCLNHTKAPEYSMSDQRRANAVPLSKLAQSNSKSEDTPDPSRTKMACGAVNTTVYFLKDDSIKVQNEMTKKAQDTSLDEQLMEVMLYVRTTHEVEHNDNQWTREFVFSFDEAKAKINRLIVLAKLEGFDIAFDCHDYDRLRAYKEQLTKELGDSNG